MQPDKKTNFYNKKAVEFLGTKSFTSFDPTDAPPLRKHGPIDELDTLISSFVR